MNQDDLKLYELYLNKIKETDEISFKLLGLVPLISGAGIFTLLTQNKIKVDDIEMQIPIFIFWVTGVFGALITYCIYRWELRNIQTCKAYKKEAKKIEEKNIEQVGVFINFPEAPSIVIRKSNERKMKEKIQEGKRNEEIKITIGKAEAEKGIYFLTILFWLLMPVLKMCIYK